VGEPRVLDLLFNTWTFAGFFLVVYALYRVLGRRHQNALLLIASYVFYGSWDWRFLSLLMLSTGVDYLVARRLHATEERRARRGLLLVSLATNLGILGTFKYCGFFIESATDLLGFIGLEAHVSVLEIVLPVGISFYTFQTMAYTIDVYRRRAQPVSDLGTFALYVSYFPQLVAGPIERAQNLIPQFEKVRVVTPQSVASGLMLIFIGLIRKVAIADVAAPFVDRVFADPASQSSSTLMFGTLMFALQIYGDFAGYSDIARGISRLLGIELMENFNHPYFARNISVFWRRWHISLSTWLRDYLYIPLGGSRGSRTFIYRNLMLTMLLGGLWHGAAWTFIIWGAIHGGALIIHKRLLADSKPIDGWGEDRSPSGLMRTLASWALTMLVVNLAWIFFRCPDLATAIQFLGGLTELRGGFSVSEWARLAGLTTLVLVLDVPQALSQDHTRMLRWSWPVRGASYATLLLVMNWIRNQDDVTFLYFQF